jgi:hypothetical protein
VWFGCGTLRPAVDTKCGGNAVEKYGLSVRELEAQSRVELLPDRIEMARGRRRNRVRVTCANQGQAIALLVSANLGFNVCPVQVGNFS